MSSLFYHSLNVWKNDRGLSPLNYLVQIKLSALNDLLANKWFKTLEGMQGKEFPVTKELLSEDFLQAKLESIYLTDPFWDISFPSNKPLLG